MKYIFFSLPSNSIIFIQFNRQDDTNTIARKKRAKRFIRSNGNERWMNMQLHWYIHWTTYFSSSCTRSRNTNGSEYDQMYRIVIYYYLVCRVHRAFNGSKYAYWKAIDQVTTHFMIHATRFSQNLLKWNKPNRIREERHTAHGTPINKCSRE